MRIGLVHPRLDHRGGAENVVLWMARGLTQRGFDVVVATQRFSPERWDRTDWDGVSLVTLQPGLWEGIRTRAASDSRVSRQLRRALEGCDLIAAHNSPAALWATMAVRRMAEVRVVWYCEEPSARFYWRKTMPTMAAAVDRIEDYPWAAKSLAPLKRAAERDEANSRFIDDRQLDHESIGRVDQILANSAFTAKNAERVFGRTVAPCVLGVPIPPEENRGTDGAYVAWITSPVAHKNAHGFLEAIRIAVHELGAKDLRLRIVGLDRDRFGCLAAEKGITHAVRFEDWMSDADLNSLIAACSFLAYPVIDEPFGLVPLHAMAHGRAVLTSNMGGPSETVLDGATGLHANPMDPRDMAERLIELWCDPARCDDMGAAGRDRYYARFTFDHFLDRFERIVFGGQLPRNL